MCACFMYEVDFRIGDGHEPSISVLSVCLPIKLIVSNVGESGHAISTSISTFNQSHLKWITYRYPIDIYQKKP